MHQQPPKPHQDMHLGELEAAGPSSRPLGADSPPRTSRPGSIVGHLHPPSPSQDLLGPHPARVQLDSAVPRASLHQQAAQQHGSIAETVAGMSNAAGLQTGRHAASVVQFPPSQQIMAAPEVQHLTIMQPPEWSAAAHLQAIDLLLQAAQAAPGNAQVALQHLQSISMLCQACMVFVTGAGGTSQAAAPLQSMQSLCSLATAESLQQPHAQAAMWLSLRLLFGQVSDILSARLS